MNENVDYTIENGLLVFTRDYLKRRGSCCGSGCRNCPYHTRIVSMVPSWTETLIEAGARVVGRTRFCIHPRDKVNSIQALGGTKEWNIVEVRARSADLVLLDQEENPKTMADESPAQTIATHVTRIEDVAPELRKIASGFTCADDHSVVQKLLELSERWEKISSLPPLSRQDELPGVLDWIQRPGQIPPRVAYFIWNKPWMTVTKETFIGSVLSKLGFDQLEPQHAGEKYPAVTLDEIPPDTLLLFSSEPYPFQKRRDELQMLRRPSAIVDGESFSWFGVRTLVFLEHALQNQNR